MATFAFIHGASDVGWYWHLVEADLRDRGHETVAPDLPIEDDDAGLSTYADVVVGAIAGRRNVVVVAQSFGGYVAPIVADRIDARLIVLVAGMMPSPGESAEEMFERTGWQPEQREDTSSLALFYHDVPRALAEEALARGHRRQSDTPAKRPGRSRRGRTRRHVSSSAATIGSFPHDGCGHSYGSAWASCRTRSTAVIARR
jgi:pimeloyl-ACP methyl ester carboxylesterase